MIIGLTGRYCAGKNHIGLLLEKRGLPVLDADKLGHEVIRREAEKIILRFGKEILAPQGVIDRKKLGKLVFGCPEKLAALEAIIHPAVNALTEEWIGTREKTRNGLCVINAALLHKSSVYNRLGAVIVVCAPFIVRVFRAVKRDKLPLGAALKRILSQKGFPRYKARPKQAQLFFCPADIYSIHNSGFPGSLLGLEKRIDAILEGLSHGKEKITDGCGFGRGGSGNRSKRCDSNF